MPKKDNRWEILVTVLIPREPGTQTADEAIDAVGDRLKPWSWTAQMPMDNDAE